MRTPEQINRQLRARMAELEKQAENPSRKWPCQQCRHFGGFRWKYIKEGMQCVHPLAVGFDKELPFAQDEPGWSASKAKELCGPEKALWEPRRNFWEWFVAPWREQ